MAVPEGSREGSTGPALVYSLVIPAHDDEAVIGELSSRLIEVMDALDGDAEAILVDDGAHEAAPLD